MQTSLTVSSIRAFYEYLAAKPTTFIRQLNEVTNRLMNHEALWAGCSDEVLFATSTRNYIVLPRQFVAILGVDRCCAALPVFSQFHQYIEMGLGWVNPAEMTMAGLIDDAFTCTQIETSGTFTLRIKLSTNSDAGKLIRFFGEDENSLPIYTSGSGFDGINYTTVFPLGNTTQQFTKLTGIQAPPNMVGRWTLWQVVSGTEVQVGTYEPGETNPMYRKYKVGVRHDPDVIRCYCSRQWIPAMTETDFVYPGCLSAIKMGFKALQLEDANKKDGPEGADAQWERAYTCLDDDLARTRGYQLPSLRLISGPYPRPNHFVN